MQKIDNNETKGEQHGMYAASERILVDQVVQHTADMELLRPKEASQNSQLDIASHMIGHACVQLAFSRSSQRDYRMLTEEPIHVLESVRKDKAAPHDVVEQARLLEIEALMVRNRNFPTEIQALHSRLRMETASQLGFTIEKIKHLRGKEDEKKRGSLYGKIAQLTSIALLNQGDLVPFAGLYSLPHLERTRKQHRNHDASFFYSNGDEEYSQSLQIKLACGGHCENGKAPESDPRNQYAADICLISGCCDLGLKKDYDSKLIDLSVPIRLVDEQYSPESIGKRARFKLNLLSEELAHTILSEGAGARAGTSKRGRDVLKEARAA